MKYILTILLLCTTTLFFGQITKSEDAAIFLDLKAVSKKTVEYIDPNDIESVNVIKNDTLIDNVLYQGQLFISLKKSKKYDFLTLEQIKYEYTKIKSNDVVYMINGLLIKEESATLKLNRNYIYAVEVTTSEAFYNLRKGDIKFDIINILGKTKENLEKSTRIILRSQEKLKEQ